MQQRQERFEAEVQFFFVKSHFNKDKDIVRNAGLSSANDFLNYQELLQRCLIEEDIYLVEKEKYKTSSGYESNKCSQTLQKISFPAKILNSLEPNLKRILKNSQIYTIKDQSLPVVFVKKIFYDDQPLSQNQANIQNQLHQQQQHQQQIQNRQHNPPQNNNYQPMMQGIFQNQNNQQQNPQERNQNIIGNQIQSQRAQQQGLIPQNNMDSRSTTADTNNGSFETQFFQKNQEIQKLNDTIQKLKQEKNDYERKIQEKETQIRDQKITIQKLKDESQQAKKDFQKKIDEMNYIQKRLQEEIKQKLQNLK